MLTWRATLTLQVYVSSQARWKGFRRQKGGCVSVCWRGERRRGGGGCCMSGLVEEGKLNGVWGRRY